MDSWDPIITRGECESGDMMAERLQSDYPDAVEAIDANLPAALIDELAITVFVDSDHAHDKVTRRSVTGIIILVGRTPVFYQAKRQG